MDVPRELETVAKTLKSFLEHQNAPLDILAVLILKNLFPKENSRMMMEFVSVRICENSVKERLFFIYF